MENNVPVFLQNIIKKIEAEIDNSKTPNCPDLCREYLAGLQKARQIIREETAL